jgi:hypothetical protein
LYAGSIGATSAIGPWLPKLVAVEDLGVPENSLDDSLIPYFFAMPHLRKLWLDHNPFTVDGIRTLRKSKKFYHVACYPHDEQLMDEEY